MCCLSVGWDSSYYIEPRELNKSFAVFDSVKTIPFCAFSARSDDSVDQLMCVGWMYTRV